MEIPVRDEDLAAGDSAARQRLDLFLARRLPGESRSAVALAIRQGRILVNGRPAKPAQPLRAGDIVQLDEESLPRAGATPEAEPAAQSLPLRVLYEDGHLLVVDKEPGMAVHPGAGRPEGTLVNALLHLRPDLRGVGPRGRPGIVHRLDRDTSGLLLVAKEPVTHRALSALFAARQVRKEYLALVWGAPRPPAGIITAPVGRSLADRKRMSVLSARGREALTEYRVERPLPGFSLLRLFPRTGRTHQLRVHLRHLGHPIVGDPLYGGRRWRGVADARLRALLRDFPRQALHAARLRLRHPATGAELDISSPLPRDIAELLAALEGR